MKRLIPLSLFTILLLFPWDRAFSEVKPPQNPNSAKGCAICHYRWIDTFFVEGRGSDLVEYNAEKVEATPGMCMSCHDGSIMDSRDRLMGDHGHKTGIKPPAGMEIPKIFPLDQEGRMQCATCHTAHGVPSGEGVETTVFMRTSNRDSAMCRMCHPEMDGGPKEGNHPVGSFELEIPEDLNAHAVVSGKKKNHVVCETCHTAHGSRNESFLIDSARDSGLCLACHRDKNAFTEDGRKRPVHVVNVVPREVRIPESLGKGDAKFGVLGEIICQTCHKVHNNKTEQKLLLIKTDKNSTLCLTCHEDKRYLTGTKHDLLRSAPHEKNAQGQTASEAGICSACHLPHKTARELSGRDDFTTQLCLSCHSRGKMAEKINLEGNTHPLNIHPLENSGTNRGKLSLPLFDRFGIRDMRGKMTCATCHEVHGRKAYYPKAKPETAPEGDKILIPSFLRKPSPEICGECHSEKFDIADSKHDLRKASPAIKNISGQTPAQSGLCGTCHLVHGSRKRHLWAREIMPGADQDRPGLCESCHNEKGIAKKKLNRGYSHPLNIAPRDKGITTTLPLFDDQGRSYREGVMTCSSCHDPHRSGASISTVNRPSFLRKPSPAICGECHAEKFYVANSKHDLEKVTPGAKNILDQTPSESGLCGNCHLAHNALDPFLWARDIPARDDHVLQNLCIGCHSSEGIAREKAIKDYNHPVGVAPSEKGMTTILPLFDDKGRSSPAGLIACPTCHDPHRWNAVKILYEPHFKTEGNSQDSFLRLAGVTPSGLCTDCHKEEARIEKTDHDLKVTAPASKNALDQTPLESGTCGVCHLVHNSKNRPGLWARDLEKGSGLMEMMCTSCHSKAGAAKDKRPAVASHPEGKLIVNRGKNMRDKPDYFPLFDTASGKAIPFGDISCPSCHNPHRWDSRSRSKGEGVNLEGDATNSFLRVRAEDMLCKDCHGPDALYRLLYYHRPDKRIARGK